MLTTPSNIPENWETIVQILQWRAHNQPCKIAYRFLVDGESEERSITYFELYSHAISLANQLKAICPIKSGSIEKHSTALLLFPSGIEFISAFFGCLIAGVIAIPAVIPRNIRSTERIKAVVVDSGIDILLTDKSTQTFLNQSQILSLLKVKNIIIVDKECCEKNESSFSIERLQGKDIAFIQYTSGSTSQPKGVIVSHQNIIANQKMIKESFNHNNQTIFAGWLPLFHDMGLIGNVLHPLYLGIPSILMSPVAFLQKPLRWLQAISRYKATTSGAPNFAYDLCVEKIKDEETANLDLSSWNLAFNGSEPIHAKTLERFSKKFSLCGFKEHSFYPCYGLAEATLFVSGHQPQHVPYVIEIDKTKLDKKQDAKENNGQEGTGVSRLVSCGTSCQEGKIVIVDPKIHTECPPFQQGEVWIQGPHISKGYWGRSHETGEIFTAKIAGQEGTFLRTGDLGILDNEHRLYITGRLKDLLIIRGRNLYPQDIELSVQESDDAIQPHGCTAFCVERNEEERLVIVCEIKREKLKSLEVDGLHKTIRQNISFHFSVNPFAIVLIKPGHLPKTSSGKIQRQLCKQMFLSGQLEPISQKD